jgi:integrase
VKHFPGLYRRANGLYGFSRQFAGVRHTHSLGTRDLQEAIARANKIQGQPISVETAGLADWIEPFLAHKKSLDRYSAASIESKRYILQKFARLNPVAPRAVTAALVKTFYETQRAAGLADETIISYLSTVRAFFRWCVDVKKLCRANPTEGLHLPRIATRARRDFCTPDQVQRLIEQCPRADLTFVLFCGFHAGMRKQEIIEARPFWFDVPNRQIHLRKHDGIAFKDREERSIPMTSDFAAFLTAYGLRAPYMLHPEVQKGKSLYRYDFEHYFEAYLREAQLPFRVTTHTMRHTFASLLASARALDGGPANSIYEIAVWLGDDIRVVQKHYAKLLPVKRDVGAAFRVAAPPGNGSEMVS